jgi:RNA polymerase sigma-70 factor (ECF subfamily)
MSIPHSQAENDEMRGRSDRSLLRRFRRGEEDAATELYLRYAKRLRGLARNQTSDELAARFDPEDIVQSVFRTFFRRAAQGHYSIPDGEELWKLFLIIALNKVRAAGAYHRAAKRDVQMTSAMGQLEPLPSTEGWRNEDAYRVLRIVIDDLLSQLPPAQRKIVRLRFDRHDVANIARMTQRSKRSVERILQRFRKQLSDVIDEESHGGGN